MQQPNGYQLAAPRGDPVRIIVPGEAKTERKRQGFFKDKAGNTHVGARTDTPDRKSYKSIVRLCAAKAMGERPPLEGPVSVVWIVYRLKPGREPQRGWRPTRSDPWPSFWWRKPDLTNYWKLIEDALTGIVWKDDAQVCEKAEKKQFGERARVEIVVQALAEPTEPIVA